MNRLVCMVALGGLVAGPGCALEGIRYEQVVEETTHFSSYLISYRHDGLKLHALVAEPRGSPPVGGFPILIANHGFVPDPSRYGITADGTDSRPGDYYRAIPDLYTSRGYIVVMPDYRGHNSSEGIEDIGNQNPPPVELYAEDVLALLGVIDEVARADTSRVFMWSHSMGGSVSARVLLGTDRIKAASFWSTDVIGDQQGAIGGLAVPMILHHSIGDTTTPYRNTTGFAEVLAANAVRFEIYSYETDTHFFEPAVRVQAANRDAAFFDSLH